MNRKIVKWRTPEGKLLRLYFKDMICMNPQVLETIESVGANWESIKITGDNTLPPKIKFIPRTIDANNPEYLGIQNPSKEKSTMTKNEDGTETEKAKRIKFVVTPELLDKIKILSETMTTKQAEAETLISYANLFKIAKENGFVFVKGKRGRPSRLPKQEVTQ